MTRLGFDYCLFTNLIDLVNAQTVFRLRDILADERLQCQELGTRSNVLQYQEQGTRSNVLQTQTTSYSCRINL